MKIRLWSLNSLVRDLAGKVDTALGKPTATEKVENLLAVRDESQESMKSLERLQGDIGFGSLLGTFGGLGLVLAGIATAPAAVLASPLLLAGAAVSLVFAGTMFVMGESLDTLRGDRDTIRKHINSEVQAIAKASPAEAEKSPLFLKSLYSVFNDAAAAGDKSYETLVAKVAPKPVPAPVAAPAA